jgi:hypothetical protein
MCLSIKFIYNTNILLYHKIKPCILTGQEEIPMDEEYNQLMLERQQQLEEALDKAESGVATQEDWAIIRYECGIPQRKRSEA